MKLCITQTQYVHLPFRLICQETEWMGREGPFKRETTCTVLQKYSTKLNNLNWRARIFPKVFFPRGARGGGKLGLFQAKQTTQGEKGAKGKPQPHAFAEEPRPLPHPTTPQHQIPSFWFAKKRGLRISSDGALLPERMTGFQRMIGPGLVGCKAKRPVICKVCCTVNRSCGRILYICTLYVRVACIVPRKYCALTSCYAAPDSFGLTTAMTTTPKTPPPKKSTLSPSTKGNSSPLLPLRHLQNVRLVPRPGDMQYAAW